MNEEFAIKLKLIMDETSVNEVKTSVKSVKEECESLVQKTGQAGVIQMFDLEEPDRYSAKLQLLKYQIDDISMVIKDMEENPESWGERFTFELLKAKAELEKLVEQYNKIAEKQREVTEETKETEKSTSNLGKTIKQVFFGIIGINGLYSSIRKAMSAYLNQNDELKQKINACWYALGSLMAPVLEYIVNLFVKLVSFVDAFLKALGLAGINMSKYAKATAKANKEQQKQLAGFDEINNLSKESESGGGGAVNPFSTFNFGDKWKEFFDFVKLNAEMLKLIGLGAMFGIGVAFLFTGHPFIGLGLMLASGVLTYKHLTENWDYIVEKVGGVKNVILGLLTGFMLGLGVILLGSPTTCAAGIALIAASVGVAAMTLNWDEIPSQVKAFIGNMISIIGTATAVLGLLLFLFSPTHNISYLLMAIGGGVAAYGGWKMDNTILSDWFKNLFKNAKKSVSEGFKNIRKNFTNGLKDLKGTLVEYDLWDVVQNIAEKIRDGLSEKWEEVKAQATKKWEEIGTNIKDKLTSAMDSLKSIALDGFNKLKSGFDGAGSAFETIANTIKSKLSKAFDGLKTAAQNAWNNISSVFDSGSSTSQNIAAKIKNFFAGIRAVLKPEVKLPNVTGSLTDGNLWWTENGQQVFVAYAQGTNYVPNDQLAYLHKGEAVIPADFNNTQGTPYTGNNETNELLRELVNVVQSKEFRAVISQREVGQASVDYIHRQSRIMGENIV